MTLKGDAIFRQKLTGDLKNDIKNLITFHASSCTSKNCTLMGSLCPKHIKMLRFIRLKSDPKKS